MFTGRTNTDGRGLLVKQRLKDGDGRGRETHSFIAVWKLQAQIKNLPLSLFVQNFSGARLLTQRLVFLL